MKTIECGNCITCPTVKHQASKARSASHMQDHMIEDAVDPRLDQEMGPEQLAILTEIVNVLLLPGEQPAQGQEEVVRILRKRAGEMNSMLGKIQELSQARVSALTDGCTGPLKMRASKGGRVITATVCVSPSIPNGSSIEKIDVNRTANP